MWRGNVRPALTAGPDWASDRAVLEPGLCTLPGHGQMQRGQAMVTAGKHGMAGFSRGAHKTVWSSTLVAIFGLYLATAASASDWQLLSKTDTNRMLYDIWGTSATDMFVVGQQGTFMRSSGTSWLDVPNNPKSTDPNAFYTTVWGTSASNIYIGGGYWLGPNDLKGFLLHYDGSAVSVVADNLPNHVLSVWGSGASDVWAAGGYWGTPLAMHYDGASWTQQTWGGTEPGEITSVWGTSSDNVYAICGDSSPKGQIWHYNGSSWEYQTNTGTIGYGVWGTDANNVFAVGNMSPTVAHYDGSSWGNLDSGTSNHLYAVGGTGPQDVFVGGENGLVKEYNGSQWTSLPSTATGHIQGFSSPNSSIVFAVSDTGEILTYVVPEPVTMVALLGGIGCLGSYLRRRQR